MSSFSSFLERFRRVTSSGSYMPEVDGLRFIAIAMVVGMAHTGTYMQDAVLQVYDKSSYASQFLLEGVYGVSVFFIISGFILALPFATQKLLNGKQVSLQQYFLRRVTRLEPTYIVTLILYFVMRIWILKYESFNELLPHFFASLFYVHNIVYDAHSAVNGVAWSLEVEIQFYLLAPFSIKIGNPVQREQQELQQQSPRLQVRHFLLFCQRLLF